MNRLITWLSRKRFPYEPLINVNISKKKLLDNFHQFQTKHPNLKIAPVLKSNAYGHGLFEVAHIVAHQQNVPFCIVDSYFEAVALRSAGLRTPLLIIGYTRPETMLRSHLKHIIYTVTTLETLKFFNELEKRIHINLKIDTGMHRQGISLQEVDEVMHIIGNNNYLILEGVSSHLGDASNEDPSFTEEQVIIWNNIAKKFRAKFPEIKYFHLSATEGYRYANDIDANVARLGLGLYGLNEKIVTEQDLKTNPVLSMETIITGIKKIQKDDCVGYCNTFKAEKEITIATIPVGYYEGVDRRLSNKGYVLVGNDKIECPIIGRVSMNITTINVSHVPHVTIGMKVIVISDNKEDLNSVSNIAKNCDTIPYDVTVHIPSQLKRVVV